jgi:hypothetical protein
VLPRCCVVQGLHFEKPRPQPWTGEGGMAVAYPDSDTRSWSRNGEIACLALFDGTRLRTARRNRPYCDRYSVSLTAEHKDGPGPQRPDGDENDGEASAAGSRLQIFTAAPGSAAMQQLLWSFVPTVLVPFSLISHGSFGSSFVAHVT